MDESRFLDDVSREIEAKRIARKVLGVAEGASPDEIKRAWRRASIETHPDRNPSDPDAQRQFRVVNCAYQLLAKGTPCNELLNESEDQKNSPADSKYNLNNPWGLFLWWREKFF